MKKSFVLFITLLTCSISYAQILHSIGMKGGISNSNQTWYLKSIDKIQNTDFRNGTYTALSLELFNTTYLSLVTDVSFSEKGHTMQVPNTTNNNPDGDGTFKTLDTKFNYLGISPMLKARIETNYIIPYVLLGIRMDNQLSYQSDLDLSSLENDFMKMILGANFGAGAEYKIKQFGFLVEGQYQYDLSKLVNTSPSNTDIGLEITNEAFVLSFGLKYYLQSTK